MSEETPNNPPPAANGGNPNTAANGGNPNTAANGGNPNTAATGGERDIPLGFKPGNPPPAATPDPAKPGETVSPPPNSPKRLAKLGDDEFEVPEELWDPEKNAINAEAAAKRAIDLRKQLGEKTTPPETYAPSLPEALAKEFEGKWEIKSDDPRLPALNDFAKKRGWDQQTYSEVLAMYARDRLAETEQQQQELGREIEEDVKRLNQDLGGDVQAPARIGELDGWLGQMIQDKNPQTGKLEVNQAFEGVVRSLRASHAGTMFLLAMRERAGGKSGLPQAPAGGGASETLTIDQLRQMQADPRYDTDPAFFQQVEDGYKKLYPAKTT